MYDVILDISIPEDFEKKCQEYREMLLSVLNYNKLTTKFKTLESYDDIFHTDRAILKTLKEIKNEQKPKETKEKSNPDNKLSETFEVVVKDREIWVNNFLIGKPHAVGNNFEFFDYVRQQPPNTKIEWRTIPDTVGWSMMKEAIKERRFIKILNALGFKGEIKKAFFYKVGKNTLHYKGDKVAKEDLEKAGVRFNLFIKELEVANAKIVPNSPI